METKILISILISAVLLVGLGIVMAHEINKNDEFTESDDMTEHMAMMGNMHGGIEENVAMTGMMDNMDMNEEMHEVMEEMMNNETLREEMSEHMKNCPMMKRYASS